MQSTGRCLCGSVQYTIAGAPTTVLDCHCSMCRRESGASSLVFVGYRRADVSMGGPLKYYRSSNIAKRGFPHADDKLPWVEVSKDLQQWPQEREPQMP
jgi:hypothetical protein